MKILAWLKRLIGAKETEPSASSPKAELGVAGGQDELNQRARDIPGEHPPSDGTQETHAKPRTLYVLGVDLGTHGTKLAYREVDTPIRTTRIIHLSESGTLDRAPGVVPSVVASNGHSLLFGKAREGFHLIENFKMHLIEDTPEIDGSFSPADVAALFLAWVVRVSLSQIRIHNPTKDCDILLNVGVPYPSEERDRGLHPIYSRILRKAWHLAYYNHEEICDGLAVTRASELLRMADAESDDLDEQWYWRIPELKATVTTIAQHQHLAPEAEYHVIVDLGGYTTDFFVFNTCQIQGRPRASLFLSEVIREGMVAYATSEDKHAFIGQLRQQLLEAWTSQINRDIINLHRFNHVHHKLLWQVGGGSRDIEFTGKLLHPDYFLPGVHNITRDLYHGDIGLEISDEHIQGQDLETFFTVAVGLTIRARNLIDLITVNPLPPPPPQDPLDEHDEYGLMDT